MVVRDVKHGLLENHHGLLARPVRGFNCAKDLRPGPLVLLLDPPVQLQDVLLVVHPREVANTSQPRIESIPQ